ncbi:MAG TPA: fibronectin type III domain-containing protein, partial [Candidatus Thermoplasmatota archaeon]|nr:fibronectin type III domain-containing protein [Candidatus Thermoplasmatota archaeon]
FVPGRCYNLVDRTPPAITEAYTVDVNGNGVIDGLRLTFNEPVNDASFCDFDTTCYVSPSATYDPATGRYVDESPSDGKFYDMTPYGIESKVHIIVNLPSGVAPIHGPFIWDTIGLSGCGDLPGCGANDRFGILKWPEQDIPGVHAGTGVVPDLVIRSYAPAKTDSGVDIPRSDLRPLFQDFSQVCDFTTSASSPTCTGANAMKPLLSNELKEADGAPPIVLKAETVDSETKFTGSTTLVGDCKIKSPMVGNTRGSGSTVETCIPDPDGRIDAYRLTFSEKINDATFDKNNWKVGDGTVYRVTGYSTGNRVTDAANDEILHVVFDEADKPDTDARPEITYTKPGGRVTVSDLLLSDPGLKDRAGVPMNSFGEAAVTEVDRAVPVIVSIKGLAGQTTLDVEFSEGVQDSVGASSLVARNFIYSNSPENGCDKPGQLQGASGLSGVEVAHVDGGRIARLTVNVPLCENDLTKDTLAAAVEYAIVNGDRVPTGTIRESQPSLPVSERQFVLGNPKKLNLSPDGIPPEQITDLRMDISTANSVRISFTAPGDDGKGNGKVSRYDVRISKDPITEAGFTGVTNDATLVFEPALDKPEALVLPGERQQVTITGLQPTTQYYVAVVAEDDAENEVAGKKVPNRSKVSNIVTFETKQDVTPPPGEAPIVTANVATSTPTTKKVITFSWTELKDPESVVKFHYKFDTSPEANLGPSDPSVVANSVDVTAPGFGTYYFHLRACSAGGCQPVTVNRGPYLIQPPTIASGDLEMLTLELQDNTEARRVGKANHVSWTVPEGLPQNVDLVGFLVFRLEDGQWVQIADLPATATNYTDEEGGKNARYLVTMKFAGHPEPQTIRQPTAGDFRGTAAIGGADGFPTWGWALLGVAGFLLLAGLVTFLWLRNRGGGAQAVAQDGFVSQEAGPAGT